MSSRIAQFLLEDGDFHHIALTVTQTVANIYFHGVNIASRYSQDSFNCCIILQFRTLSGAVVDAGDSEFVVGGGGFVGAMQDARFYSSALSTE